MPDEPDLAGLEAERARLYADLSVVGDFRKGTLSAVFRKCGKPNCRCARPGERGHGPQYNLARWLGGKTVTMHLRPGPELEKAEREVAEFVDRTIQDQLRELPIDELKLDKSFITSMAWSFSSSSPSSGH